MNSDSTTFHNVQDENYNRLDLGGLLKNAAARPLVCILFGLLLVLGLAQQPGTWAYLIAALASLTLGLVLQVLIAFSQFGRPSIAEQEAAGLRKKLLGLGWASSLLFMLAGAALGAYRGGWDEKLLRESSQIQIKAAHIQGRVLEVLEGHRGEHHAACVLGQVKVEDLVTKQAGPHDLLGRVRLGFETPSALEQALPGDQVSLYGSLYPAKEASNPGEYDYRRSLLAKGISCLASAHARSPVQIQPAGGFGFWAVVLKLRRFLLAGLERCLEPAKASLVAAILYGDKSGLPRGDLEDFNRSGLSYLLAVAGLHLGLVLALALRLGRAVGLHARWRACLGLAVIVFYALASGLQIPVLRAGVLFLLLLLAQMGDLGSDFLSSFSLGALVVLLWQPHALQEAGFQFSFGVTASIVFLSPPLFGRLEKVFALASWEQAQQAGLGGRLKRFALAGLLELICVNLAAQLVVIPVQAWHFYDFSYPAFISTLLVVPLLPFYLGLGLVCSVGGQLAPGFTQVFAWLLSKALGFLIHLHHWAAHLPAAALSVGQPRAWWIALWVSLALFLALSLRASRGKLPILCATAGMGLLVLLLCGMPVLSQHAGKTDAWFFDVGQGDSILLQFGDGKTLLVDGGPARPDEGRFVLEPALRYLGISHLDWVCLTHPHADHYGGLIWVLSQFPVGQVLDSGQRPVFKQEGLWQELQSTLAQSHLSLHAVQRGDKLPEGWQGRVELLSPLPQRLQGTHQDWHNNNLVLRVGNWLWLAGDMEKEGEANLLSRGLVRPTLVLKVGHHGSQTSCGREFLKALRPKLAVMELGLGNRFSFPRSATLERLKGIQLYRSDLHGCVFMEESGGQVSVQPWRQASPNEIWKSPKIWPRNFWKSLVPNSRFGGLVLNPKP